MDTRNYGAEGLGAILRPLLGYEEAGLALAMLTAAPVGRGVTYDRHTGQAQIRYHITRADAATWTVDRYEVDPTTGEAVNRTEVIRRFVARGYTLDAAIIVTAK
jgi:hypothetical protein